MPSGSRQARATLEHVSSLAAVRDQHPGWRIWASDKGRLWATRTRDCGIPVKMPYGWALTIDADDAASMGREIERQESLDASA